MLQRSLLRSQLTHFDHILTILPSHDRKRLFSLRSPSLCMLQIAPSRACLEGVCTQHIIRISASRDISELRTIINRTLHVLQPFQFDQFQRSLASFQSQFRVGLQKHRRSILQLFQFVPICVADGELFGGQRTGLAGASEVVLALQFDGTVSCVVFGVADVDFCAFRDWD